MSAELFRLILNPMVNCMW